MIHLIPVGDPGLARLEGALDHLGFRHQRTDAPAAAEADGVLLLAGSGSFDDACASLKASGWWWELPQRLAGGQSLLGLDLGLHLLAEGSEASPRGAGLALIPGIVRRLGPNAKVPHVGWAPVLQNRPHPVFPDPRGGWLYFRHTHALEPTSQTISTTTHGRPFAVLEIRGRAAGIQALPAHSGSFGLALLAKILLNLGEAPSDPGAPHLN